MSVCLSCRRKERSEVYCIVCYVIEIQEYRDYIPYFWYLCSNSVYKLLLLLSNTRLGVSPKLNINPSNSRVYSNLTSTKNSIHNQGFKTS